MWPRLLEKVYAKLAGSYYSLEAKGIPGQPVWPGDMPGQQGFPRHIPLLTGCAEENSVCLSDPLETVEERITALHEQGFCLKSNTKSEEDFGHDHYQLENGIVPGHCYAGPLWTGRVEGRCLVYLRNTWGKTEWTGEWSDTSGAWEEHPEVKNALLASGKFAERTGQKAPMLKQGTLSTFAAEDDGGFLIELSDLCKHFRSVDGLAGPGSSLGGKRA